MNVTGFPTDDAPRLMYKVNCDSVCGDELHIEITTTNVSRTHFFSAS